MNPKDTLDTLHRLHERWAQDAHTLIVAYADGNKKVKMARDALIASEQVIFIFARAVQRQLRR